MSVDFFTGSCQDGGPSQDTTRAERFGLCDDVPGSRAYVDEATPAKWIAVVDNPKTYEVTFTSIDNCIRIDKIRIDKPGELPRKASRCDGVLTYESTIIFVELKAKNRDWLEQGIGQLQTTIAVFFANYSAASYSARKAYLANSDHPRSNSSRISRTQKFQDETGVALFVEAGIKL